MPRLVSFSLGFALAAAVKLQPQEMVSKEILDMEQAWASAADRKQAALIAAARDGTLKKHDFEAERDHIKAMRAHLDEMKKQVLSQAKLEMEKAMSVEKEHEKVEEKRLQAEADRLKVIEERNKHVSKKEVVSAKRLYEEGEISRPMSPDQVALNRRKPPSYSFGLDLPAPQMHMNKTYVVDNRLLLAHTKGLGFRKSKNVTDKSEQTAKWGTSVRGVDQGDGWVKVGELYLPTTMNDKLVLSFHDVHPTRYEAPETEEDKEAKVKALERQAKAARLAVQLKDGAKKGIFEFGKGVRNELVKAQHDITKTLEEANLETKRRNQATARRHAAEIAKHKEEVAFHHRIQEQEQAVSKEDAKRAREEAAAEKSVKSFDREWANKIRAEDDKFKAEAKATKWASSHFVRAAPGRECPAGWTAVLDKTACKLAGSVLAKDYVPFADYKHASDTHPAGCYLDHQSKHVNFNLVDSSEGSLNALAERVCTREQAASNRELIHQELHVDWAEKQHAKALEEQQRVAEEAADAVREPPAKAEEAPPAVGLATVGEQAVVSDTEGESSVEEVSDENKRLGDIMVRSMKRVDAAATLMAKDAFDVEEAKIQKHLEEIQSESDESS